ncbi:hypothetical protein FHL15_007682 [Xylaria flabelliformis]|uniref:Uncharacterized protein n=1 Tax=Xylaria flabelliformis TaxID=2512241 RepID=A0A553HU40_9PEZI|nr:hypothetical protein FHL15_007682 [Xylaria flabelliformis]
MADILKLPSEAVTALTEVKNWLLKQKFTDISGLRFYSSPELVEKSKALLDHLPDKCKEDYDPQRHDTRVTAIHIHATMTVPVKNGSNGLLIPVHIGDGATLDGMEVHPLQYAELKQGLVATPDFYALLLLSRAIA